MTAADVSQQLTASLPLAGVPVELDVTLEYRIADPFAVTMVASREPDAAVSWVFARDLLQQGMFRPVGGGDVWVVPSLRGARWVLAVELSSPDGSAALEVDLASVRSFLARSERLVPFGREGSFLDLDGLVSSLLGAA